MNPMPRPPSTRTIAAATSAIRVSMSFIRRAYDPPTMQLTPPLSAEDHVDGPDRAELELVMYGDFQCPYCTAAYPIVRRVRDQLAGRLLFAFRHFPLRDVHPDAERAAQAAEAAAAQGAFWQMHDKMYESRGAL